MGTETENRRIDESVRRAIEESQVQNRNALGQWLVTNWKTIAMFVSALGLTNGGQLAGLTIPSLEQAKRSGHEVVAAQEALRMTGQEWMAEIRAARNEEREDCSAMVKLMEEHCATRLASCEVLVQ